MGWKAAAIFVNKDGPGYFGQNPEHRPALARQLITELGLGVFEKAEQFPFGGVPTQSTGSFVSYAGAALYPPDNKFEVGAYDQGLILSDQKFFGLVETADSNPIMSNIIHRYGQASIMLLELHSVVGYVAYAMYEHQHRVRAFSANGSDGEITLDVGDPLPEEKPYFDKSYMGENEHGLRMRKFKPSANEPGTEEYDHIEMAETLAFACCTRFFGTALDMFGGESLQLERFTRKPWWKVW